MGEDKKREEVGTVAEKTNSFKCETVPMDIYGVIFSHLDFSDFLNFTLTNKAISKLPYAALQQHWKKWFEYYFPEDYKKYNTNSNSSANTEIDWHQAFIAKYKKFKGEDTRLFFRYLQTSDVEALKNKNFTFTDLNVAHGEEILNWVIQYGTQEVKNYLFTSLKENFSSSSSKIDESTLENCRHIFNQLLNKFHKNIESVITHLRTKLSQKPRSATSTYSGREAENELMALYAILLNQSKNEINNFRKKVTPYSVVHNDQEIDTKLIFPLAAKTKCFTLIEGLKDTEINHSALLHYAASGQDIEVVKHLIEEKNANINGLDKDNKTPLHHAVLAGNIKTVKYLIQKGATIDALDNKKKTPLHYAASMGNIKTVKYLIENGADINALDNVKKTPLDYAASHGHLSVVKYFVETKEICVVEETLQLAASTTYKPSTLECLWKRYISKNRSSPDFNPARQLLTSVKEEKQSIATKDNDLFFETDFLKITFESNFLGDITIANDINIGVAFKENKENKILSPFCAKFNALIAIEALIEILKKRNEPEKIAVLNNLSEHILETMNMDTPLDVDTWLSKNDISILNTPIKPSFGSGLIGFFTSTTNKGEAQKTTNLVKTDVMICMEKLASTIKRYTTSATPSVPAAAPQVTTNTQTAVVSPPGM